MPLRSTLRTLKPKDRTVTPTPKSKRRSVIKALKKTVDKLVRSPSESLIKLPPPPEPQGTKHISTEQRRHVPHRKSSRIPVMSRTQSKTSDDYHTSVRACTPSPPPPPPKPLTEEDYETWFAGAPQFAVKRKKGGSRGELECTVTTPYGKDALDTSDHRGFTHRAFAAATARNNDEEGIVTECPSMRSFQGREPGTCGWEYFLNLPVGDAAQAEAEAGLERGGTLMDSRAGVRSVEVKYIAQRLQELGAIWAGKKRRRARPNSDESVEDELEKDAPSSVELYTHLFAHLLYPPTRITTEDYDDPYSLRVQITQLVQTLTHKIWLDFSNITWRIRLGQILWADDTELSPSQSNSEKATLLLQILLAAELFLRLDTLQHGEETPGGSPSPPRSPPESTSTTLARILSAGGAKVSWDLLLARRWLENVRIIDAAVTPAPAPASSFLPTSWFSAPPEPTPRTDPTTLTSALLAPRHPHRQIDGLLHFARQINWPGIDAVAQTLLARTQGTYTPASSNCSTPLTAATPLSYPTHTDYFTPQPKRIRELNATSNRPNPSTATLGAGGWLSRTYLTGLLLPGETLPHLLLSTLLENDTAATQALGYTTNLYSGFQYSGSTWWSRFCVIGRVLAPLAREEAGWVGPCMASGVMVSNPTSQLDASSWAGEIEGWADIPTLPAPHANTHRIRKRTDPRGLTPDSNMPDDFYMLEQQAYKDIDPRIRGLHFEPLTPGIAASSSGEFPAYAASVHVSLGETSYTLQLAHDVQFITAWPCTPPPSNLTGYGSPRHLLHKSFVVKQVELRTLLSCRTVQEARDVGDGIEGEDGEDGENGEEERGEGGCVLTTVFTPEERVAVQAWCASVGENAVIVGEGCAGCAVREAVGLGVVVVVRVGY